MFTSSTYFIKGQIPRATKEDIIKLYERELETQAVSKISTSVDSISFANNTFKFVLNRFANKYSSFSKGQIRFEDQGNEFGVYFQADITRIFTSAGLMAGITTLFILVGSGFHIYAFIVGIVIFILLILIGFISTSISFPVYFTRLRNDIERELQTNGR